MNERSGLSSSERLVGTEQRRADALGDTILNGPSDGDIKIVRRRHITKVVRSTCTRGSSETPQKGDRLGAGKDHVWPETVVADTHGQTMADHPAHRLGVPRVSWNIDKAALGGRIRSTRITPEERREVRPSRWLPWTKEVIGVASSNSVCRHPTDGRGVKGIWGYVSESVVKTGSVVERRLVVGCRRVGATRIPFPWWNAGHDPTRDLTDAFNVLVALAVAKPGAVN